MASSGVWAFDGCGGESLECPLGVGLEGVCLVVVVDGFVEVSVLLFAVA